VVVLISLAILGIGIILTLAMILLVGRFVPDRLRGAGEKRGWIFEFCGVLYALVVGFVLAFTLSGYQSTESDASVEADSVTALSRSAALFDHTNRDKLDHELICYARTVIDEEWPAMSDGHSSQLTTVASDRLYDTFGRLGTTGENDVALSGSLDRIRELDEARASRIIKSTQRLPAIFWIFMVVGGLMLTGYAVILNGRESIGGQMVFILPVTLLLLCAIYLVALFEQPFQGSNAIKPTAMRAALYSVERFAPQVREPRRCD